MPDGDTCAQISPRDRWLARLEIGDCRLRIADCRLARMGLFSLASKLAVGVYRARATLRFLLLAKIGVGVARLSQFVVNYLPQRHKGGTRIGRPATVIPRKHGDLNN